MYREGDKVTWTDPEDSNRTIEAGVFALPHGGTNPLAEVILIDSEENELFEGKISDLTLRE